MQKIFYICSVILVCGFTGVNSLQCYVCNNCTNPTDDDLMSCGEPATAATPSTVSSAATSPTTPSSLPTTVSSVATTVSSEATTVPSVTTTVSPVATTVPSTTPNTSPATTAASAATTAASAATTAYTNTYDSSNSRPGGTRSKRSVLSPFSSSNSNGCDCRNEANCECDDNLISNRIAQYANETQYVCYKVVKNDGAIYRGCGPATWVDGKALCESAIAANVTSCRTCDTDKCNGSFTIQYSVFMLLAAVGLMMLK